MCCKMKYKKHVINKFPTKMVKFEKLFPDFTQVGLRNKLTGDRGRI